MGPETYYEILGIGENADDDAVKQAFRDLAKHFHPDRNPDDADAERQFKRINTAYEGLKDASRRQAYNEWLAFANKREKVKRTQWGRLAALVFLLLIGPSAVLYWAVIIADIPLFADHVDKIAVPANRQEAGLPPPKPERRQPLPNEAPEQRTASPTEPAGPPANPPQAAPDSAPAPAVAVLPVPQATNDPAPGLPNGGPDKGYTQALPHKPTLTELLGESSAETASREAAGTADEGQGPASYRTPEGDRGQASLPNAAVPQAAPSQGDNARDTARMLARLKEPQGALPGGSAGPSEPQRSAAVDAAPPQRDGLPPDTFTDCDECPIISAAGSNEFPGGTARAAISLSEITLADWDGCVADRACPPYERPTRGNRRETIVEVAQRDAEAYAAWLSATSGKSYRQVMSPRRRESPPARRCNGARTGNSGWEWLDDDAGRNCPPAVADAGPDAQRGGFRVFRKIAP